MFKSVLVSAILLINLAAGQFSSIKYKMFQNENYRAQGWSDEHWFSTRLDHFDHKVTRWFQQRYWMNDEKFDRENGPIILYICGEWTCHPPNPTDAAMAYGQNKGGILIALEHRYYGSSQPFDDWSTHNLKWLNTTQALEDTHKFINYMKIVLDNKSDRKVMIIGGSYPGAFVAWYQQRYQDVTMVWSSSGVVKAIDDFKKFDFVIYNSTNKSEGCKEKVKELTDQIDQTWANGDKNKTEEMLQTFGAENMNIVQGDFMYFIADHFAGPIQHGQRVQMCTNITGTDAQSDPLGNLAKYGKSIGLDVAQYDATLLQNITYNINSNLRQWTYQYCTMFAWYQVPNDEYPQRSQSITVNFWPDYCRRIFGAELENADVDDTNSIFLGTENAGDYIYFFTAIEDPWQWAGMREVNATDAHEYQRSWLIDADQMSHCVDLKTPSDDDPQNLKDARADAYKYFDQWYNSTDSSLNQEYKELIVI